VLTAWCATTESRTLERTSAADAHWEARLLIGDAEVLEDLYESLGGFVYRVAYAVTRDHGGAEDVTQIVMIALWEHPERYRSALGALRPFVGRLAHGRAVDWVRREAAIRQRETWQSTLPLVMESSLDGVVEGREEASEVQRMLAQLPEVQRTPIMMAFFGELTYAETARQLGLPTGTVKSRIRRGLQQMALRRSAPVDASRASDAAAPSDVENARCPSYGEGKVLGTTLTAV